MDGRHDPWLDEGTGPIVRPYALTRGRTRPDGEHFPLIAVVWALVRPSAVSAAEPECLQLLSLCQRPTSVVDLASDSRLPLGVTRVLLGDLRRRGMIGAAAASRPGDGHDRRIIQEVLNGLRAL